MISICRLESGGNLSVIRHNSVTCLQFDFQLLALWNGTYERYTGWKVHTLSDSTYVLYTGGGGGGGKKCSVCFVGTI